ncbi:zinc finger protein 507 [Solea solea]|uniref:zinc finger protein 507 n=1 Tax=Solea solea TaxID=90069 RepID=UPI00272C70D3|nr:zinc finger protein 507 [Solea solea]
MEEISNGVVLSTHSSSSAASAPSVLLESTSQSQSQENSSPIFQHKQASDSLIQVIEKLSRIVEKQPPRRCTAAGQKRAFQLTSPARGGGEDGVRRSRGSSPSKKVKIEQESIKEEQLDYNDVLAGDGNNNSVMLTEVLGCPRRTVTCYQCSLCPFISPTLPLLKEHLKQHNEQHSDLILMCSECHFTSRDQEQLEAHVRLHFDHLKRTPPPSDSYGVGKEEDEVTGSSADASQEQKKTKWYSYEEYGLYRCLICSYVCSQQRMLKTHAWKHAGLVDCSYPIFEDEDGAQAARDAQAAANSAASREEVVVLPPALTEQSVQKLPAGFKLQLCVPLSVDGKQEVAYHSASNRAQSPKSAAGEDRTSEEALMEVQVRTEAETQREGHAVTDSLLSSAQKIINGSPNGSGRMNVIVERLPSAEDSVMAANPLLLDPDVDRDQGLLATEEDALHHVVAVKDCGEDATDGALKSSSPRDESVPPAARKRTHSESLRLHSLAAEVLVAMPMRTTELLMSSTKGNLKTALCPNVDQKLDTGGQKSPHAGKTAALKLHSRGREKELGSLDLEEEEEEEEEEEPATKAGISLSLLTVIERLRERSDQNTSDEDILRELQDNAQFQNGDVVASNGAAGSYVCTIPGMEGLAAPPGGGLVDYVAGSERPYRCRLCRYSSSSKGYIKHHLRVHRQRQPYQCPICEHVAADSVDLESHMIHHCKTRMYQCKQCPDAFHYKSQLRTHEREQHSLSGDVLSLTAVTEAAATVEEAERVTDEDCAQQRTYKCDVCDYTSSTYVGVRNHRRIHNSDKPYRCCSCDFATTNMNSLKSHMRRHPQEHQAVQLLEQYRCSLCGYVCSHPPSLKSHMWKHAGDQNYNYEQVNQAINEAISQSSRAPPKLPESSAERPTVAQAPQDKVKVQVEPTPTPTLSTAAADVTADVSASLHTHTSDPSQWPGDSPSSRESDSRAGHAPLPGPGMEYCVLLFCCCICGFESTSKERLMEHMKEHEGDIISIILNKEQQQQADVQQSLQTAE